jgi:hypothetical protein
MNLVISVSGGETSGYMMSRLLSSNDYDSISCVFANTGQENEETLIFIDRMAKYFNINIIWLESVTNHNEKKSSDYRVVSFDTADRTGKVFEDMIKKYGISNMSYPHCTRELKNEPIKQWCIDNFGTDYAIAIGIRTDESSRIPKTNTYRTVYPLITGGIDKQDVIEYWESMPFRLGIENYQGNCKWCWKKSDKKLWIIAHENPLVFDFPKSMEEKYGLAGANDDGTKRVFFRGHRSAQDILNQSAELIDDAVYQYQRDLIIREYHQSPIGGGCSESCEAFTQESLF